MICPVGDFYCAEYRNAYGVFDLEGSMAAASERMRAMRARRRGKNLREVRLVIPDAGSDAVRARVAAQVAGLDGRAEAEALDWTEAVAEFDERA